MSFRTISLMVGLTLSVAVPSALRGQTAFSIAGGAVGPAGNLSNSADIGYNVALAAHLGGTVKPLALRIEAAHNGFNISSGGERTIQNLTANLIFNLRPLPDSPYLIAGAGAYRQQANATLASATFSSGRTSTGINLGAGLRFPLVGLSTFLEARYHYMSPPSNGGASTQFVPLTFGIVF